MSNAWILMLGRKVGYVKESDGDFSEDLGSVCLWLQECEGFTPPRAIFVSNYWGWCWCRCDCNKYLFSLLFLILLFINASGKSELYLGFIFCTTKKVNCIFYNDDYFILLLPSVRQVVRCKYFIFRLSIIYAVLSSSLFCYNIGPLTSYRFIVFKNYANQRLSQMISGRWRETTYQECYRTVMKNWIWIIEITKLREERLDNSLGAGP